MRRSPSRVAVAACSVVTALGLSACTVTLGGEPVAATSTPSSASPSPSSSTATPVDAGTSSSTASTTSTPTSTSSTTTTASTPDRMFAQVSDGVLRIAAAGCAGVGSGSGFLVADDLALTVAHVLEGAGEVSVRSGDQTRRADVVGYDLAQELALLRLREPLPGHVFRLAGQPAGIGTTVHALGYPRGGPLSLTTGTVSGLDRRIPLPQGTVSGLLQLDAAISPGNSGGPVVDGDGVVVGLAEATRVDAQNVNYAVPAAAAAAFVTRARDAATVDTSTCDAPGWAWAGVSVQTDDPAAEVVAATFAAYAAAVNDAGDPYGAWDMLTPEVQQRSGGFEGWAAGMATTHLSGLAVESVDPQDATTDVARLRMTSTQDAALGPGGQTCSVWTLDYRLVLDLGHYQIDRATAVDGAPRPCDPAEEDEALRARAAGQTASGSSTPGEWWEEVPGD